MAWIVNRLRCHNNKSLSGARGLKGDADSLAWFKENIMKRWHLNYGEMTTIDYGEYIEYTDHEAVVKHLKANDLIQEEEIFKLVAEIKKLRDALEKISFAKIDSIEKEDMELFASELIDIAHKALKDGE